MSIETRSQSFPPVDCGDVRSTGTNESQRVRLLRGVDDHLGPRQGKAIDWKRPQQALEDVFLAMISFIWQEQLSYLGHRVSKRQQPVSSVDPEYPMPRLYECKLGRLQPRAKRNYVQRHARENEANRIHTSPLAEQMTMMSCSGLKEKSNTSLWRFFSSARRKFNVSIVDRRELERKFHTRSFRSALMIYLDRLSPMDSL